MKMAINRTTLRKPYWWVEVLGFVLTQIAMWIMPAGTVRHVLLLVGSGMFIFGAKAMYDDSRREAHRYDLFSTDRKLRIP